MKQPKNIQQPKHYGDHDDAVQNRFNAPLHRDESIDQPQQDTHNNQNFHQLKQRHGCRPFFVAREFSLDRPSAG
jgi:hypothetical protein